MSERKRLVDPSHALSTRRQCELLGVARSSVYYKGVGESKENLRLMAAMDRLFTEDPTLGVIGMTDGCHLRVDPGSCQERGEFIYFMSLDNFANSASNRVYYAKNYYPRNILHETTHLLQQGHWYRKNMPNETFSIPAFYSEGQAELMSYKTGLRTDEMWNNLLNYRFSEVLPICWTTDQEV